MNEEEIKLFVNGYKIQASIYRAEIRSLISM